MRSSAGVIGEVINDPAGSEGDPEACGVSGLPLDEAQFTVS